MKFVNDTTTLHSQEVLALPGWSDNSSGGVGLRPRGHPVLGFLGFRVLQYPISCSPPKILRPHKSQLP
eukprot:1410505-Pyramimonas_sp.AAC.3